MFLTIPNSDSERLAIVAWLGTNGITCYLRFRGAARELGQGEIGDEVTILVPEGQLQAAKRVLGSMPAESDPP